ncbi:MAG: T9SS type A sorting domain-containing protein [Flavobacteriaceae bacterium]|nr:T9SS type A sorting domain-containing protein [Flavobacteriaceae bacterium]
MKQFYFFTLLSVLFYVPTATGQALPITEVFNYAVGSNLGGQGGWVNAKSGDEVTVQSGSLSYEGLLISTANSVTFSGAGINPQMPFESQSGNTVYASFIFRVTDLSTLTDTNGVYFAGFGLSTTVFGGTVWLRTAGTQFNIGINKATAVNDNTWLSTNFDTNTDIFVVIAYDLAIGEARIWVNPVKDDLATDTPPTPSGTANLNMTRTSLSRFFLRQASATETPTIVFDELRIGTTWASVTPIPTVSLEDKFKNSFAVFPNPATNGFVNISSASLSPKDIHVYDVLGKLLVKQTISGTRLNIENLKAGVYILKVAQDGRTETKKLVIR